MKKNKKTILAVALLGAVLMALSGCGKKEPQEEGETKEFVYVPEYHEMDLNCDYIYAATAAGDNVFINAVAWDEENENSQEILYKYNMLENKSEQLPMELDENSSVSGMAMGTDGNLLMAVSRYLYETNEAGDVISDSSSIELWEVSANDGSVISTRDITELMGNSEYARVQYFCVDKDGNFYFSDGDSNIYVTDKELNKLFDIKVDNWINSMVTSKEGEVFASSYGETGLELKKVDLTTKKLGDVVEGLGSGYGNRQYYTGNSKSLLVGNSDQVSLFDVESGTLEDLYKWLDVDINSEDINYMGELSDGRIWALTRSYSNSSETRGSNNYELVTLNRKNASEVAEKKEIVYGALWIDSGVKRNIIDFNKTNGEYRVTVKEYGTDDYQTGLSQMNADLTTGNCPDIIDLSALDINQYASKGILEDLYPYMEKSGINKEDYLENILKAYETDGKLYGLISQFTVSSTLAKSSLTGDINGWTLTEMLDFVEDKNPENVFQYGNRNSIFYYCIYNNIDEFINWETGECFFNDEGFIRILEFAAKFPEKVDYDGEREGMYSMLQSDKILLMQNSISSVQEFQMLTGLFGEKVAFVGYPNSERKGNLVQPNGGCMGLSSKSENKDGAWEFMKTMISEEYQDSLIREHGNWGFPIRKETLEKQFEKDMTPEYYEDENGEKVEQAKTTWGWDDFEMEIMAATQEEIDAVKALIASAEKTSSNVNDEQLTNIITEESEPFFKGQKTAADTAAIIQNRIQIYVNENR